MKETITINCIYENDLEGMMKKIDLWKDYKKGTLKCFCGKIITDDNLTGFVKKKGKVYALCSLLCNN